MRRCLLTWRCMRHRRIVGLFFTCASIIFSVITVQNFTMIMRQSVDGFYQEDVDYFAKYIQVGYKVIQNQPKPPDYFDSSMGSLFEAEITLTNTGRRVFPKFGWSIFFSQVITVEPAIIPNKSLIVKPEQGVQFRHWNGQLYSLEPTPTFVEIRPKETKYIRYYSSCCNTAFTDVFPNWYIVFKELEPRILESTAGEPDRFVAAYNTSLMWKRDPGKDSSDHYNPPTAKDRFDNDGVKDLGNAPIPVIPTPANISVYKPSSTLNVFSGSWVVVSEPGFQSATAALKEGWNLGGSTNLPESNYIQFIKEEVKIKSLPISLQPNETYKLVVNPAKMSITIKASHAAGAFYAVQSLFSLVDKDGNVPEIEITDGPRYRYRGLMLDVARNFHSKETIMRYIETMAMYKLNKLHLHLTDDEGWRLEIPDLPELTEIGGKRCHDPSETVCILPFHGSGPNLASPGTGFYTVEDYKDILRHAVAHHVEVIPEIDMPGHSHAAIKAMQARFLKMSSYDPEEATRYLLTDLDDESEYASVQNFKDGAINPCLQSTYTFIKKILTTLLDIHKDISPLQIFHFGGDEVPKSAWIQSKFCIELNETGINKSFKAVFAESVADLSAIHNLNLAVWEDGLMNGEVPFPRKNFPQKKIFIYAWNNLWVLHQAKRAYTFANAGYQVILTPATTTYLDHPYEPDPTERGLIWATRFINTKRVFKMMPEKIYASEDIDMGGNPIPECSANDLECPPLMLKDNIEGIQGTLFGELSRTSWIIDYMVFPRLIALAERAWHTALWENESIKSKRDIQIDKDWVNFANTLGHKELARLDRKGILYRIPPPGAIVKGNKVTASVEFPGLVVQISTDGGNVWTQMPPEGAVVQIKNDIQLRTKAADSDRYSKIVHLK